MLARKAASYDDLLALPDNVIGEIIDGELVVSLRPAGRHSNAASLVGIDIGGPFFRGRGGPGGWIVLDEPELHIVAQVLVPDLAGWRRERMPWVPDVAFFDLAPDWVCEVLSPSTALIDRTQKQRHYASAGVRHLWFIDPKLKTLEVLRLDGNGWRLAAAHGGDEVVRVEPFEAVALELSGWWVP